MKHRILFILVLLACTGFCPASSGGDLITILKEGGEPARRMREKAITYQKDGRKNVMVLYQAQADLVKAHGWILEEIYRESYAPGGDEPLVLPMNCLKTRKKGPALWILSGIHGEEPAGPNAIAENVRTIAALGDKGIPVVLMPLLNPLGYCRNWRYPDAEKYSDENPGRSVGDSDHLLLDEKGKPRRSGPLSPQCAALTAKVLELARDYPPVLTMDYHEDNELEKGYLYSQGKKGADDPVAREIVRIFQVNHFPLKMKDETRFGEVIREGIIADVKDGSIDELLGAGRIFLKGASAPGPSAKSVIVLETSSMNTPLEARKKVHATVLKASERLWRIAVK
ncbi:MAG: hypothetical protein RDV48_14450 [Candidatus Eremiobacteraeota bacterium]|nr:hypothetical protein [Candidatus Eremiobacteraeota bacterium]